MSFSTPQLHLIGEIKQATGFPGNRCFCKYAAVIKVF